MDFPADELQGAYILILHNHRFLFINIRKLIALLIHYMIIRIACKKFISVRIYPVENPGINIRRVTVCLCLGIVQMSLKAENPGFIAFLLCQLIRIRVICFMPLLQIFLGCKKRPDYICGITGHRDFKCRIRLLKNDIQGIRIYLLINHGFAVAAVGCFHRRVNIGIGENIRIPEHPVIRSQVIAV